MRWAAQKRQEFITALIGMVGGGINRSDLIETFRISAPTASADFTAFQAANPGVMVYSLSKKRYERDWSVEYPPSDSVRSGDSSK